MVMLQIDCFPLKEKQPRTNYNCNSTKLLPQKKKSKVDYGMPLSQGEASKQGTVEFFTHRPFNTMKSIETNNQQHHLTSQRFNQSPICSFSSSIAKQFNAKKMKRKKVIDNVNSPHWLILINF